MAVGFKIDNETLALSVIIGAGLLYYFTHDQQTAAEVKHKRDDDRKGIAVRNLDVLEHRFDALQLGDTSPTEPLLEHISSSLKMVLEDAIRLQSESNDIAGIGETFFQHTAELVRSGRHYLGRHAEHVADVEAHKAHQKGVCATTNVAQVTNVAVTHNHFDQRTQHQTSILAVQDARKILNIESTDARSQTFNQQNNELKQLNIRNPHSDGRGSDVRVQGGENTHALLTHVTKKVMICFSVFSLLGTRSTPSSVVFLGFIPPLFCSFLAAEGGRKFCSVFWPISLCKSSKIWDFGGIGNFTPPCFAPF